MVTSRLLILVFVLFGMGGYLIYTIFQLQIVKGEEYFNNFQLRITRERTIPATRGNILDRDGNLLAYNELAYSVTIEDVYEPYLMQLGFLTRTPRGRCVTQKAYQHLHKPIPGGAAPEDVMEQLRL